MRKYSNSGLRPNHKKKLMELKDWAKAHKGNLPTSNQLRILWGYSSGGSADYMVKVLRTNGYITRRSFYALTAKGKKAKYKV